MQANRPAFAKIIITMALMALPMAARADEDYQKNFTAANSLYDQGKFDEARKLYETDVAGGKYSPELFYNLGNTDFRLDQTGHAILNYERALALEPNNPEIQANLAYARAQAGARVAEPTWRDEAIMNFGVNGYSLLAVVAAWAAIFAIAALLFRPASFRVSLVLTTFCCAAVLGYAIFAIHHLEQNKALAIVTEKSTEARYAPADNSTLAGTLPEGSRVWILERRGPWVYCRLPDNTRAWITSGSVERVRLQNS